VLCQFVISELAAAAAAVAVCSAAMQQSCLLCASLAYI